MCSRVTIFKANVTKVTQAALQRGCFTTVECPVTNVLCGVGPLCGRNYNPIVIFVIIAKSFYAWRQIKHVLEAQAKHSRGTDSVHSVSNQVINSDGEVVEEGDCPTTDEEDRKMDTDSEVVGQSLLGEPGCSGHTLGTRCILPGTCWRKNRSPKKVEGTNSCQTCTQTGRQTWKAACGKVLQSELSV